jgi:hypothetical protein
MSGGTCDLTFFKGK